MRVLATRRVYEGKVLSLDVDEVLEPGDVRATREVVRHRGSVAALPVHEDGRVVLVRQYRYAVDALVWELPAGRLDPGESVEDAARREMEEEVGLRPRRLEALATFYTTPGFCDEVMEIWLAEDIQEGEARHDEDEHIELVRVPFSQAVEWMVTGEIRDAKTMAGLWMAHHHRSGGRLANGGGG